ncbi:MAG: GyrI-like domain-containing protein, partial [Gammaproteobacteria bacterium]
MNTNHKPQTNKQYQERINLVWLFIQNNLDENLTLEELAAIAFLSPYHFHRIFTAMTGESIIQYIRRLRLERAAGRMIYTDHDITTIGLANGYETPAAFSRAFKQHFGSSPSTFRKNKDLSAIHGLENIVIKTNATLDYSIVHFKPQRVLFIRKTGHYLESAFSAWECLMPYALQQGLINDGARTYGIPLDCPDITKHEKMRYDACITVDDTVKPNGEFGIQTIRGGRYAVFTHTGHFNKLEQTYNQIILNWLPNTNYDLMHAPSFESYLNPELLESTPEKLKTEIFIPI